MNVELVKSISIVNCKIIGHGLNRRDALVNLKTRIEGTDPNYAYTTDLFMPLRADRLNANLVDVYTYSGILATHTKNFLISCVDIECTGNRDFASEADTTRTQGIGIILRDVDLVTIQHSKIHETYGTVKATGLQLERVCGIDIYDSDFSYATSSYLAAGIESFPDFLAKTIDGLTSGFDFTVEEFDLCEVKTEFQRGDTLSMGIYLTDTRGVNGQQVAADRNVSPTAAFGLLTFTSVDISFTDSTFDRNIAGPATATLKSKQNLVASAINIKRTIGSLNPSNGIYAIGFFAQNCNSITTNNVSCSSNSGENTARGMHLTSCTNNLIQNSTFSRNEVITGKLAGEDDAIRDAQLITVISKHAPIITRTGSYGLLIESSSNISTVSNCTIEGNSGHRSIGLQCINSESLTISNNIIKDQQATGSMLHPDVQNLAINNVPFPTIHQSLFASDACDVDPTFGQARFGPLIRNSLNRAEDIRSQQLASGTPAFNPQRQVVSAMALSSASMSRFRLWGTALGIHLHNAQNFVIQDCISMSNTSEQDSALGIVITGRSSSFEVINCDLSFNEAWTDSALELWDNSPDSTDPQQRYQYDLSAMKDFWYFLGGSFANGWLHAATTSDLGFYTGVGKAATGPPDVMIAQGEQVFGTTTVNTTLPHVRPQGGAAGRNRHLIAIFGPIAAGILCGDLCSSVYITNNLIQANYAHAGQGFGISLHLSYNATLIDNIILNNGSNMYGFGAGILDLATYSPNMYLRNFLSNNKVKSFMNSNIIIPMGNVAGNSFQIDTVPNDTYDRLDRPIHNIEITIPNDPDACTVESNKDGALQTNLTTIWTTNSWIS